MLEALAGLAGGLFTSNKTTVSNSSTTSSQSSVNPSITVSLGGGAINSYPTSNPSQTAPANSQANGGADGGLGGAYPPVTTGVSATQTGQGGLISGSGLSMSIAGIPVLVLALAGGGIYAARRFM